ncbi:S1/P1 nuclease [Accumulibacter sp.]|uniref:S1/P1 nuclease n=1 Tax=Accumulibacter sp. TaxID=2053492 RepID=UPI001A41F880|nr:S1/P1 nuclease [Accumulibacter sp.]MBL8374489.1 S1/P1 nuclease [Accumulibacter sp.]
MSKLLRRSCRLTLLLLLVSPVWAWNAAGHRISAMIAWEQLDTDTRAAVAALLRQHPDFERWQARGKGTDQDLTAFLEASTWPDDIRKDQRFYTAGDEEPTPTLAGFPDMERRLNWHYVDRPLNRGGDLQSSPGTIDRQLGALAQTLASRKAKPSERAYALPWIIHLVADAHQPLHAASRYGRDGRSDNGGNALAIINPYNSRHPSMSLHRYWDDLPGPPWLRNSRLEDAVRRLTERYSPPASSGTPTQWLDESWRIAREHAYPPGDESVPTIGAEFHDRALEIANRRVIAAGYRLADLLQRLLR